MQVSYPDKPEWLTRRATTNGRFGFVRGVLEDLGLHTVCGSSKCPNRFECWSKGRPTFMVLGDVCTRSCRFCAVDNNDHGVNLDPDEPLKLALAVKKLGMSYAVVTSVTRDDLDDHGAGHFAKCVASIKSVSPSIHVEATVPDFGGRADLLLKVIDAGADVITHNIETVERLSPEIRDRRAGYYMSLDVLKNVKRFDPRIVTKTSLMLGFGESEDEVRQAIEHMNESRVDIITMGQYLRPSVKAVPVAEYVPPDRFDEYRLYAEDLGFKRVVAAPFVRSSYRASEYYFADVLAKGKGYAGR